MKCMKLKEKARQLKRDIPAVFLALKHEDTPIAARILAGITVGYALSPIDLIPDFVPLLGYLDDLLLLPMLVALTITLIPKEAMEECRRKADGIWKDGKPEKWYYALPVILIWILLLWLIIKMLWV